jgi:hypothetical protein
MPPKLINTMRYSETWNCTTAGGTQAYSWRMNDIYDAFVGAGGAACHGIDEMQSLYQRYRVIASRIKCTMALSGVGEQTNAYLFSSADTTAVDAARAESAPDLCHGLLSLYRPVVLSCRTPISRYLDSAQDRDCGALANADPAAQSFFNLVLKNFSGSALNVLLRVEIEFDTLWSQRIDANDADA